MSTALVESSTAFEPSRENFPAPNFYREEKPEDKTDIFDDLEDLKNPFSIKNVIKFTLSENICWSTVTPVFSPTTPVHNHIKEIMIDQISLRKRWEIEGIKPPNIFCKNKTKDICIYLFDKYEIIPKKVDASKEEGIFVLYLNPKNDRTLEIEIYNDLDVAAIVTDNNRIVASKDIEQLSFDSIIRFFK